MAHRMMTALGGAMLLAACSGGGGGGGSGSGTVITPTPTTSTPTPTPSFSYTKFADLTGDQNFASSCTAITIATTPVVYPATAPDAGSTIAYAAGPQTWTVAGDGLVLTFTPAERDTTLPAQVIGYNKPAPGNERLRIATVGIGTTPAEYFRTVTLNAAPPGGPRNYSCVIGVKTQTADVPVGTNFSFNARISGFLFRGVPGSPLVQYSINNSIVGFDVNLATSKIAISIRLIGSPLPAGSGADVDFGTVTGTADIDPATGGYYASSFASTSMTVPFAQLSGRFYGPQGKEAGYVMTLLADRPDGSRLYLSGPGVALR